MGYENMRSGHSRIPNLAIASIIVCLFLTYNWWSLSAQNYELLKQLDDMGEQLKICADEMAGCQMKKSNAEMQLRESESRMADIKIRDLKNEEALKKQKSEIGDLNKIGENDKRDLEFCRTELESLKKVDVSKSTILATMRMEKETITAQLTETKEKVKELEQTMKTLKASTTTKGPTAAPDAVLKYVSKSSSTKAAKEPLPEPQPDIGYPQIDNDPINDGNHESDKYEGENDNPQLEEMDPVKLSQ